MLAKEFTGSEEVGGTVTPATQSSVFEHNAGSVLGRIKGLELHRSMDKSMSRLDAIDSARPCESFFIHMSNMEMCNQLWPYVRLAWQKFYCWTIHANDSIKFVHTTHAYRLH